VFAVVHSRTVRPLILGVQWLITQVLYAAMILAGASCTRPVLVLSLLGILEAAFLGLAALCAEGGGARPGWLPLRAVHYLLALVCLLQFGALPYAEEMTTIGLAYVSYILTGFNRCFGLGFIMTRARLVPAGDEASPLISRVWPLMLLVFTFFAPSTNWDLAGMLTYPFFKGALDRCLYVGGALVIFFLVDRGSRGVGCDPLPRRLAHVGLLLYLFHPVLITLFLSLGLRSVPLVWLCCLASATALVFIMCSCRRKASRGREKHQVAMELGRESTDSSSEADGVL